MNINELTIPDNLHPVRLFGQLQQQRLFLWLTLLRLKKGNNISIKIRYKFTTSYQKVIKNLIHKIHKPSTRIVFTPASVHVPETSRQTSAYKVPDLAVPISISHCVTKPQHEILYVLSIDFSKKVAPGNGML